MNKYIVVLLLTMSFLFCYKTVNASYHFGNFKGAPPIHQLGSASVLPAGLSPDTVKGAYNLPPSGGKGVIAIIGAYDDTTIGNDLNIFSKQFNLPLCSLANGCFTKHVMGAKTKYDSGWALETSLDVEWAHAIAPSAKILLVEAKTPSGQNLLDAIDYAVAQPNVVAVSMSWGGAEFPEEVSLDSHFKISGNITFFASSGDNGSGPSWPASSSFVVSVGGTTIHFNSDKSFKSETAWSGSGGGVSQYEKEPDFQKNYKISKANGFRAIPDVSYDADPSSGFSIYKSSGNSKKNWYVVGGTSAGAPQWAAIKALGLSANNKNFYTDKSSDKNGNYFRDVKSGSNGDCGYYCRARAHYDYVTGLGSPLTINF